MKIVIYLHSPRSDHWPHVEVLQSRVTLCGVEHQSLLFDHALHLPLLLLTSLKLLLNIFNGVKYIDKTTGSPTTVGRASTIRPEREGGRGEERQISLFQCLMFS